MNKTQTEKIEVKLTAEQHDLICKKAEQNGMNKSEYMRFCALNSRINVDIGKSMDRELMDISFATRLFEDKKISAEERNRIVEKLIDNLGD